MESRKTFEIVTNIRSVKNFKSIEIKDEYADGNKIDNYKRIKINKIFDDGNKSME